MDSIPAAGTAYSYWLRVNRAKPPQSP